MKEALFYEKRPDGKVACLLCPQACVIAEGKDGFCRARGVRDGKLMALFYGRVAAMHIDPIEKKPLYHFKPGSAILSIGTGGCNLRCKFCQNAGLVEGSIPDSITAPEEILRFARARKSVGVAYTYNEPLIWYEYVLDCAKLMHEAGLCNVLVTNGYLKPDPFDELLDYVDALNIDLKSMDNWFYHELSRGSVDEVMRNIRAAKPRAHVEVTNLLVTGMNDKPEQIERLVEFVASVGDDTPLHFSRYFPHHEMTAPPTPVETLLTAYEIGKRKLKYVYLGNVAFEQGNSTFCQSCGAELVNREGYHVESRGLDGANCRNCGAPSDIVP